MIDVSNMTVPATPWTESEAENRGSGWPEGRDGYRVVLCCAVLCCVCVMFCRVAWYDDFDTSVCRYVHSYIISV
jgi:hypothetical protein